MPIDNLKIFENESARVKGLAFHPTRTWILAALHTGTIQLWDYRLGYIVATFQEHEGPIRCVSFHPTQSLFASGGDDSKIKLWNPHSTSISQASSPIRSLYTLSGHMDYLRSVTFHTEYPWLMSSSDDQTIRIWNWQSRTCIAVLTGHNHYVMCATFGPFGSSASDLVASASLDQTIRIWDISGLKRKHSTAPTSSPINHYPTSQYPGSYSSPSSLSHHNQLELFAANEVVIKHVLEGHDRGVNWVDFHPSGLYIVSGADDRQVKIWQIDGSRAWETDTLSGHFNNVSCVKFSYNGDIILSNSEDKTIRIWDAHRRTCMHTIRREHDRFWSVVQRPSVCETLFAASHDSGFIVFKLEHERPAFYTITIPNDDTPVQLLFLSNKQLKIAELKSLTQDQIQLSNDPKQLSSILSVTNLGSLSKPSSSIIGDGPSNMTFHQNDGSMILNYSHTSPPSFEYYSSIGLTSRQTSLLPLMTGNAKSAFFLTRNRFVALDSEGSSISLYSSQDLSRTLSLPCQCSRMYPSNMTSVLLSADNKLILYDIQLGKVSRSIDLAISASGIKIVQWSPDHSLLAIATKHHIFVYNSKMDTLIGTLNSDIPIKSICWTNIIKSHTSSGYIILFSTLIHVKYFIPSCSDSGILYQTPDVIYLVGLCEQTLYGLNRKANIVIQFVDMSEIIFKVALEMNDLDTMVKIISSGVLIGQSVISYLHKNGYPQLALKYVKEPITRFELALECADMQTALDLAKTIDKEHCWKRLADASLLAGQLSITEQALIKTKDYSKLLFIYMITGQREKIQRLGNDKKKENVLSILVSGNINRLAKLYSSNGQELLCSLLAKRFDLESEIIDNTLVSQLEGLTMDWPWIGSIDDLFIEKKKSIIHEDILENPPETLVEQLSPKQIDLIDAVASWGIEDEWGQVAVENRVDLSPKQDNYILPVASTKSLAVSYSNSNRPLDHIICGSFESAFQLLNRVYGIVNFAPLKELFLQIYQESRVWIPADGLCVGAPCLVDYIYDITLNKVSREYVESEMEKALVLTTQGKFGDAIEIFRNVQHSLLLMQDDSKLGLFCKEQTKKSTEYLSGLLLETSRKNIVLPAVSSNGMYSPEDKKTLSRSFLLLALFTHCDLIPVHKQLALRVALTQTFKYGNWKMAHGFALRLLELGPNEPVYSQVVKLKDTCETHMQNEDTIPMSDYEPLIPFVICHADYTPIYKKAGISMQDMIIYCSFCQATYRRDTIVKAKGRQFNCSVCQLTKIIDH